MEHTNNFPNLNDAEKGWLVQSAALRTDATVEDLIDSFLVLFPDRATHEGLTPQQIRETLTSRFNDILYRKDRGYAETIDNKRNELFRNSTRIHPAQTTTFFPISPDLRLTTDFLMAVSRRCPPMRSTRS